MAQQSSKAALYSRIEELKGRLGVSLDKPPFNAVSVVKQNPRVDLQFQYFTTDGFCGMAFTGDRVDTIILNTARGPLEQNFDCVHELVHLTMHRNYKTPYFQCFKSVRPSQDPFIEWQANEGAAEYIMPHKCILAFINERFDHLNSWKGISNLKKALSSTFQVTDTMVKFRLETLKYEIDQLRNGIPMGNIEILSNSQQNKQGICVESLNDIETRLFNRELFDENERKKLRRMAKVFMRSDDPRFIKLENSWLFPDG